MPCKGLLLYVWFDEKSTRGFDISFESDFIEIKNTFLSNQNDYELTNAIVAKIISLTGGIIINEDEEQISNLLVFGKDKIAQNELNDCELIKTLSQEKYITIFGPNRGVYFGKHILAQFKNLRGEELIDKVFDIILTVNYHGSR